MSETIVAQVPVGRRLVVLGTVLVMLGLLTGFVSGNLTNPRMGLASHLEGLMNGTMLIALGAAWGHVRLAPREEGWTFALLAFGALANWLATLLAGTWGAGMGMMPMAAMGHHALAWQEGFVSTLLLTLSLAIVAGIALVLKGLLAKGE